MEASFTGLMTAAQPTGEGATAQATGQVTTATTVSAPAVAVLKPLAPDPPCTCPRLPPRLAVVRRLRLGVSLYLKEGDAQYTVDLSTLRHKTRHASPTRPPPKRAHLTPAPPLVQPLLRTDDPQPAGEPRRLGGRVGAIEHY